MSDKLTFVYESTPAAWACYWDPEGPMGRGKLKEEALRDLIDQCDDDHREWILLSSIVASIPDDARVERNQGVTLSATMLLEALEFIAPDRATDKDQLDTEVAIAWRDATPKDAAGYYAWLAEYPEEGAIPLGTSDADGPETSDGGDEPSEVLRPQETEADRQALARGEIPAHIAMPAILSRDTPRTDAVVGVERFYADDSLIELARTLERELGRASKNYEITERARLDAIGELRVARQGEHPGVARHEAGSMEERAVLREALIRADRFITNGIALGYIRMPDEGCPDPAKETPGIIRAALSESPSPVERQWTVGPQHNICAVCGEHKSLHAARMELYDCPSDASNEGKR